MLPAELVPYLISPLITLLCGVLGWLLAGRMQRISFHSTLERAFFYLLLGVITYSWLATILGALGLYRGIPFIMVLILLIVYTRWPRRPKTQPTPELQSGVHSKTPWPVLLLAFAITVTAVWLYAKPAESYLLTDDSAVYTIGGISLARTGSFWYIPDISWSVWNPAAARLGVWDPIETSFDMVLNIPQGFLRQFFTEGILFTRHYGPFVQWSLTNPAVEIGFLPLPKVWIALVVRGFGLEYAPFAAPLIATVSLLAFYGLIRRSIGWPSALAATALLGISLPQLWFARLSISEVFTQASFLGGMYLLVIAKQQENPKAAREIAAWSAAAFGLLAITRLEATVMLLPLVLLVLLASTRKQWSREGLCRYWALALAAATVFGSFLSVTVAPYYLFTRLTTAVTPALLKRAVAAVLGICALAVLGWLHRKRVIGWLCYAHNVIQARLHLFLAGLWVCWMVYAAALLIGRPQGGSLAGWLGQYLTWPGLLLTSVGCILVLLAPRLQQRNELLPLFGVAILFIWLYTGNPRVTTMHPWAMRRLVPVVLPCLILGAAAIPTTILELAWNPALRCKSRSAVLFITSAIVTAAFGWALVQKSLPFLNHRERAGTFQALRQFAAGLPEKSLLLFDDNTSSQQLTAVMEIVFGRQSLVLYDNDTDGTLPMVDRTIASALAAGYKVFYVETGPDSSDWKPEEWVISPYMSQALVTLATAQVWGRPPAASDLYPQVLFLEAYEVMADQSVDAKAEIDIPVSDGDYAYLRDGFHQMEVDASGRIFRWTDGLGTLRLAWPGNTDAQASFCLVLQLSGGRPEGEQPAQLVVSVERSNVLSEILPADFGVYTLKIPVKTINTGAPELEIELISTSFQVNDSLATASTRSLGVMFYGASLQRESTCH